MALTAGDVEADIHYLSRSDIYKSVKPYTLRYKPPGSLPISNVTREKECTIIRNMRHHLDALKYDSCGFQVVELDTQMTFDDFSDVDKIDQVHRPEIEKCVKRTMQASSVQVLDYVVSCLSMCVHKASLLIPAVDTEASCIFSHCNWRAVRVAAACLTSAHR